MAKQKIELLSKHRLFLKKIYFHNILIVGLFSSVIFTNSASFALFKENNQIDIGEDYIRAVYYFGSADPITFYNNFVPNEIDKDFLQIKKDGFNTIILVVPWGEFQPSITPVKYNEQAINRLKLVIDKAAKYKLKVLLRISYAVNLFPNCQLPITQRGKAVYLYPIVYKRWLEYVEKIYQEIRVFPNVSFGFISWEDFFDIARFYPPSPEASLKIAKDIGFQDYLKTKYSLNEISKIYKISFNSYKDIPLPHQGEYEFKLLFEYFDFLMVQKFFNPAKTRFPKLSLQVRVDLDPLKTDDNQTIWYSHSAMHNLENTNVAVIYYTISMGLKSFDRVTANEASQKLDYILKKEKDNSLGNNLFIDQFIFSDNTIGFEYWAALKPSELSDFIINSAALFEKYTVGYGLWTYRDYQLNALYNGRFELGMDGWASGFKPEISKDKNGNRTIYLNEKNYLNQYVSKQKLCAAQIIGDRKVNFSFRARSIKKPAVVTININNKYFFKKIISHKYNTYLISLPFQNDYNLIINVDKGGIILDDIRLFAFTQNSQIYSVDKKELSAIKAIRVLNNILLNKENNK